MKKLLIAGIALTALVAAPAMAADLPARAPAYKAPPPPVAVVYNWTGFYVGGNIGGVTERASGRSDFLDTGTFPPFNANPQNNSFSNTRFIGGVQAGYNWQFNQWGVAGVEVDWNWTNTGYSFCRQTDVLGDACDDNGNGFETISSKTKWLATARGRVGVTVANWLLYGTGGAAWGRVDTTLTQSCLVNGCGSSSVRLLASATTNNTKSGWVAGLGAEAMLDANWSVRAEWLHIDLGTISNSLATVGTIGVQTTVWSRTERFDVFRVGANYKFGGPVYAKY